MILALVALITFSVHLKLYNTVQSCITIAEREVMAFAAAASKRPKSHRERRPLSAVIDDEDPDAATNEMLFREKKTWSKGRIQRMRIMSAFVGSKCMRATQLHYILTSVTLINLLINQIGPIYSTSVIKKPSQSARHSGSKNLRCIVEVSEMQGQVNWMHFHLC